MGPKSHCSLLAYINIWKELLPICLRDKAKIALFFKIIELLLWFKTPGQDRGAKTRPQGQLECANAQGSSGGDGQAWNWLIHYWPIVRSLRENIWTAVLKYGPNELRSVRKAKVQIFSRMDRTNWSIRALLYSHNQHLGFILDKMILNWIIMTIYTSNSFSSIFIRILP